MIKFCPVDTGEHLAWRGGVAPAALSDLALAGGLRGVHAALHDPDSGRPAVRHHQAGADLQRVGDRTRPARPPNRGKLLLLDRRLHPQKESHDGGSD